jgi:hydroxymethylbilane synthase
MSTSIRIGTRGSRLALWQANFVAGLLRPLTDVSVVLVEIQTSGDQVRDRPLSEIGGEGVFTKEIQRALLDGSIDVAVHSLKDLPTIPVEGIVLAAVPPRGPARDAFISHRYASLEQLPSGATVATSSPRRRAQLLHHRPDLRLVPIRGNVETRLRKLKEENIDGLILAEAGLERLELSDRIAEILNEEWMLPAVGQGALGIERRTDDVRLRPLIEQVEHSPTRLAVDAERSLLRSLGGGCNVPIGAIGQCDEGSLTLQVAVLDPDGRNRIYGETSGPSERAVELGQALARELYGRGAGELLNTRTTTSL